MRIKILSGLLGTALLGSAILGTSPFAASTNPSAAQRPLEDIDDSAWTDFLPPTSAQLKRNNRMDQLVQGAWQLVEFENPGMDDYQRHERGVALFGPGFFSIELHIGYDVDGGIVADYFFQSSTFRYRFDDEGNMLAKLSIGAFYGGATRPIEFVQPGSVRTFELEVSENRLELRRDAVGLRYVFTRLMNGARTQRDVFGRPVQDDPLGGLGVTDGFQPPNFEDPVETPVPEGETAEQQKKREEEERKKREEEDERWRRDRRRGGRGGD